jgi:hypothetical protein
MDGEVRGKRDLKYVTSECLKYDFNDQYTNNSSSPLCNVVMHVSALLESWVAENKIRGGVNLTTVRLQVASTNRDIHHPNWVHDTTMCECWAKYGKLISQYRRDAIVYII